MSRAVADRDRQVAAQARDAGTRHRRPFDELREFVVVKAPKREEIDAVQPGTRRPLRRLGHGGAAIPRADVLTDVAAVHQGAHRGAKVRRGRLAQLDRQVRDAARGVDRAGRDDGAGGTRRQARRALAALVEARLVGLERQARDEASEEQPRTQLGVDHAAVLADPADAGVLRVDALLDRPGVDVRPRLKRRVVLEAHPFGQGVEPLADDDVVVVAPGIARDDGAARVAGVDGVRPVGVVDGGGDDHRLRRWLRGADLAAFARRSPQVAHRPRVAAAQPLVEERQFRERADGCDAAAIKAEGQGVGFDGGRTQHCRLHD